MPLFLIALGLAAVAFSREASAEARTCLDTHMRAIQGALAAQRAAILRLAAARTAPDPATAVLHADAAAEANRDAAQQTADAAQTAQTEAQRQAAAQSAAAVSANAHEITDARADAHLGAAETSPDPTVATQHAAEAVEANREAAQQTAEVANVAQTDPQRQVAAQGAAKVDERARRIAAALAKLGVGQCGVRTYAHVTLPIRDALLAKLHGEGMTVTGDNPWDIETHKYSVKLRAVWDPQKQVLKLIVTSGEGGYAGLVTCSAIWEKIDPILREVIAP
jgi:hypothetical protein